MILKGVFAMRLKLWLAVVAFLTAGHLPMVWAQNVEVTAIVRDAESRRKLDGALVSVLGTNIATVSNKDGRFTIKVPDSLCEGSLHIQNLGYRGKRVAIADLSSGKKISTVMLEPLSRVLDPVVILGVEPRELIEVALEKIPDNYADKRNMFSSFYRETIQKGRRYVGVSEAMMDVMKTPYLFREVAGDRVRIKKGRKLVSQKASDTLAVKILGGPRIPVYLDFVKNGDFLFNKSELNYYDFEMKATEFVDNRPQYVVEFKPKVKLDYPLFIGKVLIDRETLSFTRAEFSMDMSDKDKATRALLYKKPPGLRFKPEGVDFVIDYREQDGKSFLNYIRTETRFKCDWKRRLFASGFTTVSEMVMVDRDDSSEGSIPKKESFGERQVFYDVVEDFDDEDFWNDYNIIAPTESLEKAVRKLKKSR